MKKRSIWLMIFILMGCAWGTSTFAQTTDTLNPVQVAPPRIDLQAVEQALIDTKAANQNDFRGWMKRFEDEVNAIYFATLRHQNPQADPATLMSRPVRVDAQRVHGRLKIYGYVDMNHTAGFQNGQDLLLFVFDQSQAYDSKTRQLHYSLRDGTGFYYRDPTYVYVVPAAEPAFMGFFLYPSVWAGLHWRVTFSWWGTSYWSTGFFYNRGVYYYNMYPRYSRYYRGAYYTRYRPWGWKRGYFFRRVKGRYYHRKGYWRTYNGGWRRGYYRGWRRGYQRGLRSNFRHNRWNRRIKTQPKRTYRTRTRQTRTRRSSGGRRRR
ncbi:MAG TPA: hypothetical protein DCE42_08205 [Myxococcales bacterium]|nr:hypothetical protein [Deltaproteobacteria bacterium]MBU48224.1 hypothetical protein [Deltaproteobacteria bacterium]HAA54727.1 hypothetical protein [Myxococcales bacterium]|tara:strand:- start:906 stop:1865 length:960 start_codon:yes stop_codon:yes gene_type:complete